MVCPNCGGKLSVLDVRQDPKDNETYRKKECRSCHYVAFTIEYEVEHDSVIKMWNSLNRCGYIKKDSKPAERHKCFGRYLNISPACAECQWRKECLEKSKE